MKKTFLDYVLIFCESIITLFAIIIIGFLFFLSLFNTSTISFDYTEFTYYVKDNLLRNIIILVAFFFVLFVIYRSNTFNKLYLRIEKDEKTFFLAKYLLLALIVICSCIWIFSAQLYPEADQYSVQLTAAELLKHNFSSLENGGYLYRYPFQAGIVGLSYLIGLVFGPQNYFAFQVINAISMTFIFKELSEIGKEFGLNKILQLIIISCAFIYPIFIFYTYFIYGTFIGLSLILISIKYTVYYFKEQDNKYLLIILVSSFFSMVSKSNYIIFVIALIITVLLCLLKKRNLKYLLLILVFGISLIAQGKLPIKIMETATGYQLNNGISYASDIAMGLQESERAPGWYNGYNNDSYAYTHNNSEAQTIIALREIDSRIQIFKNNPNYAFEFFTKKIASTWNNPTFQALWNLDGKISSDDTYSSWIMIFIDRLGIYTLQKYLNITHLIVLFGCLLYLLVPNKNCSYFYTVIFELCVIGGFIFHTIWEAKSQYMVNYFSLLIPLAVYGYNNALIKIKSRDFKNDLKPLLAKLLIVILVLSLFISGRTSFLDADNKTYYNYVYNIEEY